MPVNDHAEALTAEKLNAQVQKILSQFQAEKVPPLLALATCMGVFESVAEGMLIMSANGRFHSNKQGILNPMERVYARLKQLQPPAGYIEIT